MATLAGKVITNDNGVVGQTTTASKFLLDDNLYGKYRVLQSLSAKKKKVDAIASSGTTGNIGRDMNGSLSDGERQLMGTNSKMNNVMFFITKMQQFPFAPPSDNLWSIEIFVQNPSSSGNNKLSDLYSNILSVNRAWNSKISNRWGVHFGRGQQQWNGENPYTFIKNFQGSQGLFLAQNINFTPLSVMTSNNFFGDAQQHGSFFNFGNISQARQPHGGLKVTFLISNWDIGDILFDPWIAAVAQKGLIEDGSVSIKAKIVITEYASGRPLPQAIIKSSNIFQMVERKQYIFHNCFPVNRSSVEKDYEYGTAGAFKNAVIEFKYDDYEINYLF